MIVDESPFFRTIEKQFLQNTPAEVLEAKSSDALFEMLRVQKPGLVYLAYALRPLDGLACCLAIKSDADLREIPVVLICDPGDDAQFEACSRAGDAVLKKPLDRHQFLQTGRRFLSTIREHRQSCLIQANFEFDGESFKGKCLDISSGGMFIDSSVDLAVGDLIELTFKLPGTETLQVTCKGLVTWLNRRPNLLKSHYPTGFGVKFIGLPERLGEALGRLTGKQR
jgi:CheY-like chemotaxis protein